MDKKVLAMQRLQDFIADAGTNSCTNIYSGMTSVPAVQRQMATKLADFDKAFNDDSASRPT